MKKIYALALVLLTSALILNTCASPNMKFMVTVIDAETEQPIEGVNIRFLFKNYGVNSSGGTSVKIDEQVKVTNKNGAVTASGASRLNPRNIPIKAIKSGYYAGYTTDSKSKVKFSYNKVLNRWEPYPCELTVKLRKVKKPMPMFVKNIRVKIPEKNKSIGFDLEIGDWVTPYGKGKTTDFSVVYDGYRKSFFDNLDTIKLSFGNEYDGFQKFLSKSNHSSFKYPYKAPLTGYENSYAVASGHEPLPEGGFKIRDNDKQGRINIFRTRTKNNSKGEIISANYGYITQLDASVGELVIHYWFNSDNKSRSLEFSGENLFKDRDEQGRLK